MKGRLDRKKERKVKVGERLFKSARESMKEERKRYIKIGRERKSDREREMKGI